MDRRVGYADANLIWPERRGETVFDPKHSRRFSEFVVDDSSHVNLQRLGAGRQVSAVRFDKGTKGDGLTPRQAAHMIGDLHWRRRVRSASSRKRCPCLIRTWDISRSSLGVAITVR
jgi:hypothetical protein